MNLTAIAIRFWRKVNKDGPFPPHNPELGQCWEWIACKNEHGYGDFFVSLTANPVHEKAPRVAWLIETGTFPKSFVLHKCDNPSCVRFDHLFLGTQADNILDMRRKNRHKNKIFKGEDNGFSKLKSKQVTQIRELHLTNQFTFTRLGEIFGCSRVNISKIVRRLAWRHI